MPQTPGMRPKPPAANLVVLGEGWPEAEQDWKDNFRTRTSAWWGNPTWEAYVNNVFGNSGVDPRTF